MTHTEKAQDLLLENLKLKSDWNAQAKQWVSDGLKTDSQLRALLSENEALRKENATLYADRNEVFKLYDEQGSKPATVIPSKGKEITTGGKKFDSGKPPMELLSHHALLQIAEVFGYGATKYGRYNYKNGLCWSRIIGAAYRHLGAFNSGENLDPETGASHIAHLGCCVVMLLDYIKDHPELDNRYNQTEAK